MINEAHQVLLNQQSVHFCPFVCEMHTVHVFMCICLHMFCVFVYTGFVYLFTCVFVGLVINEDHQVLVNQKLYNHQLSWATSRLSEAAADALIMLSYYLSD